MDFEIPGSIEIIYEGDPYEIEYIYYSIEPDDFEIRNITSLAGEPLTNDQYKEIERYCLLRVIEDIREDLMTRNEDLKHRERGY